MPSSRSQKSKELTRSPEIPHPLATHAPGVKSPFASDVTASKKAEEALIRSEKLACIGRMATTIAHEINNPLAAVANLLFLAQHDADCSQSIKDDLAKAESELNRVSNITRQVLGFYRDSPHPTAVLIADLVNEALAFFEAKIVAKQVEIARHYAAGVEITVVPGDLRPVFVNIIANSLDAVADGGKISLRISTRSTPSRKRVARIIIADDGHGIDASALPHVFELLFTKKQAFGTGLGLWVSKHLVEKHHGVIRFRSSTRRERRGTTFVIELPLDSPA